MMKHCGTVPLETERLILRRFTLDDAQAMYDNWGRDPEVTRYLLWQPYKSVEDVKKVLKAWVDYYSHDDCYNWAITVKGQGDQPVGNIFGGGIDEETDRIHIGYSIGRPWWHQGITSEALQAVIDFFFDEVGANRIEGRHDIDNVNSGKVMMQCGMKYEGTLRSYDRNNQGIRDVCWYAILRSDRDKD